METSEERWLPVRGEEGRYEVSDQGRVRSLDRYIDAAASTNGRSPAYRKSYPGRVLKLYQRNGYWCVFLGRGRPNESVAWLVLEAFVGVRPPPPGDQARHLNDVKDDNRAVNLAWGTQSENMRDAVRNGVKFGEDMAARRRAKTHCPYGHPYSGDNLRVNPKTGARSCRTCEREGGRRYRERQRAKVAS